MKIAVDIPELISYILIIETGRNTEMTAKEKFDIALKFQAEGNEEVYNAIVNSLTADELLELLEA